MKYLTLAVVIMTRQRTVLLYKLLYYSLLAFRIVKRAYKTQILGRELFPHKLRNISAQTLSVFLMYSEIASVVLNVERILFHSC